MQREALRIEADRESTRLGSGPPPCRTRRTRMRATIASSSAATAAASGSRRRTVRYRSRNTRFSGGKAMRRRASNVAGLIGITRCWITSAPCTRTALPPSVSSRLLGVPPNRTSWTLARSSPFASSRGPVSPAHTRCGPRELNRWRWHCSLTSMTSRSRCRAKVPGQTRMSLVEARSTRWPARP